jgi:acetyl-CoA acetyltransferase
MPYPADKSFKYAANYGPPGQVSPVIKTFGNGGIEHMEKFGTTALHFAKISEKNYRNASRNPYAQF